MKKPFILMFCFGIAAAALAGFSVEPNGFPLGAKVLKTGGMELTFQAGRAVPVSVDGKRLGFLFSGSAEYRMKVTDRFSRQVLPYNLKHGSHLEEIGGAVRDEAGTILCIGRAAVALIPETTSPEAPFDAENKLMEDRFLSQGIFDPLSFTAAAFANGTDELACLISGKMDDAIYVYDPVWRQEEWLMTLETGLIRRTGSSNLRFAHPIVEQPLGRERTAPKIPPLALTGMDFDLDFRDLGNMKGRYDLALTVQRDGLAAIQLNLISTYHYERSRGELNYIDQKVLVVDGVSAADGTALAFQHAEGLLTVVLPKAPARGQTLRLRVQAHGDIFEPTPEMGHTIVLSEQDWYPAPYDWTGFMVRYSGSVRTRLPLRAFISIDDFTVTEQDGEVVFTGRTSNPDDYIALAVGRYFPKTMTIKGLETTVASAVFANEAAYKKLANLTEGVLDVYQFYFDAFPFKRLLLIEGRGYGRSRAPSAAAFASGEIFNSLKDEDAQWYSAGANERFAYLLAYQYYGHLVMERSPEDTWLMGAVSEYMAAMFLKHAKFPRTSFKNTYNFWYNRVKTTGQYASPYSATLLAGDNARYYMQDQLFCKGPVVLHAIRDKVGDNTFFTVLRSFLKSFAHQKVTTEDFIGLLNYITKEEWHPFFDRYVYGTELPEKSKKLN